MHVLYKITVPMSMITIIIYVGGSGIFRDSILTVILESWRVI